MASGWARVATLARKDFEEIRRQPAVLVPALAMVVAIALPGFFVLLIVPRATGEALAESEFAEAASHLAAQLPALAALSPEAQAQLPADETKPPQRRFTAPSGFDAGSTQKIDTPADPATEVMPPDGSYGVT